MADNIEENPALKRRKQENLDIDNQWSSTRINNEQITLIWLDSCVLETGPFIDDVRLTKVILRELNDYVVLFDNELECLAYINTIKNETVLIIVAGSYASSDLLNKLHKLPLIDSIFIFCQNKSSYEQLLSEKDYHKIMGIFNEQISLATSIKHAIELVDRQSTIFALYNSSRQKSMRDLSRESGSFIFLQLVKQVIRQMLINNDSATESKQEMIEKCRLYYRGNQRQMENIAEFERSYTPDQAIQWYTRDSFIYKLINKALRTGDIDALYTYRFYIVDLCKTLTENCQILRDLASNVTVFRGKKMSKEERQRLHDSIGHHISVNCYFSTSRQRTVAEIYAGIGEQNQISSASNGFESVLFIIDVDLDAYPEVILADIRHLSSFRDEDEILFDLGTVFKIESFDYNDQNRYWICQMKASDEGRAIAKGYLDFKQTELNKCSDIEIIFGDLLHDMNEWLKSYAYFERLSLRRINDPQVHFGIARSHDTLNRSDQALSHLKQAYNLAMGGDHEWLVLAAKICHHACRVHVVCNNLVDALAFSKEALEFYRRADENENREGIAQVMLSTGCIYFCKCDHDASLEHFQHALQIFQDLYPFDHPDKSIALSYFSRSFYLKGEYERGLKYSLDATAIHERLLPKDHPHLSVDNTCIGKLLYKQEKYDEALERFYRAADSYERQMTDNNRTYAVILNNIGKTLYRLNRLDEACVYYEKVLHFIEKLFSTSSPDHLDLAYTWKNMGEVRMKQDDFISALDLFQRARDMYKRIFTPADDHRDIAKCWHLIGQAHVALENNTEASEAFEHALRMWTSKLPKYHPDIALCHCSMGKFYADKRKQIDKAIEHFQAALFIHETMLEVDCKQLQTIRTKLAELKNQ